MLVSPVERVVGTEPAASPSGAGSAPLLGHHRILSHVSRLNEAIFTDEEVHHLLLRTMASVFRHVSVWHDPKMFSWIINGSMEPHHPDLEVSYNRCLVRWTTHAIGGLSENDFICAAKLNALFQD